MTRDVAPEERLEADFARGFLRVVGIATLAAVALVFVADAALGNLRGPTQAIARAAFVCAGLVALSTARLDRAHAGWVGFIGLGFAGLTWNLVFNGGAGAPAAVFYLLIVAFAGRMLGRRWALAYGLACTGALFALALAEQQGALPESLFTTNPLRRALTQALGLAMLGVFAWAVARHEHARRKALRDALAQARRTEDTLAVSEARFREIFDNATEAIWLVAVRADGRLEYEATNRRHAELTGLDPARIAGCTPHEAHPGPNADYVLRRWRECLEAGRTLRYEESLALRGGTRIWQTSLAPVRDAQGRVQRIVGIAHDVTERKHAEEAERAARRLVELVIDAIPMMIFAKDTQSQYLFVNRHMAGVFGTTKSAMVGVHTSRLPGALETEPSRLKSLEDDARVFRERRTLVQPEQRLHRADGTTMLVHSTKIPLLDDAGGLVGLLGINRDIAEEKRAEAALRASEQRFAALFHNSLVPQAVSDPAHLSIEDVNGAFVRLTGFERERLVGRKAAQVGFYWGAQDLEKISAVIARGGTPEPVEVRLRHAGGEPRTALVNAITIETAAGPRIAWSLVDVTAERDAQAQVREVNESLERTVAWRTEELRRANAELTGALQNLKDSQAALLQSEKLAALGRLVAGVAHELNTPIGNSLLSASTLAEHVEAFAGATAQASLRRSALQAFVAQAREAAGILGRNLEKAAQLISSFKQFAADQASSQRRSFALREVVDEVLLAHRPMLRKSPIQVNGDVPEGLRLDSYPGPLGQVLGNLITNAVLHAYEGRGEGTVTVLARADGPAHVEIAVVDEGRGIPEADLHRIFDPFFTTRLGRGGTGLGLGICHSIVTETLGGTIQAQSRPGEGSTFRVRIPVQAPDSAKLEAA